LNTRLLVVLLISVALLVTDDKTDKLKGLRSALAYCVYPVQLLVNLPEDIYRFFSYSMQSYRKLKAENEVLKRQQMVNNVKLLKLAALEKENIRLRALLENSFKIGEQVLIAELLAVKLVPYEHLVVVNKGLRFGVHEKQPVLDAEGVVGQIVRALPNTSEVLLISDPDHAIPVQVNRNGLRTIAIGSGQINRLNLPFLPNNADIRPGDLLVTSGLGGVFPQGYPVAVVDEFSAQPNKPFAKIHATPTAKLDKIREVLIVWSNSTPVSLTDERAVQTTEEIKDAE